MNSRRLLSLATLLLFAACQATQVTYPGPRLGSEEVVLIKGKRRADALAFGQMVTYPVAWIEAIDGEPVEPPGIRVELLPGPHQLQVGFRYLDGPPRSILREVELEAGRTYEIVLEGRRDETQPVLVLD